MTGASVESWRMKVYGVNKKVTGLPKLINGHFPLWANFKGNLYRGCSDILLWTWFDVEAVVGFVIWHIVYHTLLNNYKQFWKFFFSSTDIQPISVSSVPVLYSNTCTENVKKYFYYNQHPWSKVVLFCFNSVSSWLIYFSKSTRSVWRYCNIRNEDDSRVHFRMFCYNTSNSIKKGWNLCVYMYIQISFKFFLIKLIKWVVEKRSVIYLSFFSSTIRICFFDLLYKCQWGFFFCLFIK